MSETAELLPAASAYYHIVGDGRPSERPVMLSDISRMMDEGEMDGMSMVSSSTYPAGGGGEWRRVADCDEMRVCLGMLKGDESRAGETRGAGEEDMVFNDGEGGGGDKDKNEDDNVEDELQSFLNATAGMGGGAGGGVGGGGKKESGGGEKWRGA